MNERFFMGDVYICPLNYIGKGSFVPNSSYPIRYCIIDTIQAIAIDVKTRLKYNYIKTINGSYVDAELCKNITNDERIAIFPMISSIYGKASCSDIEEIISDLKNGKKFKDGNEVFNNQEYLEYIHEEKMSKIAVQKTKRMEKR